MKHIWSSSKYVTFTYYGSPVDHVTISLDIDETVDGPQRERLMAIAKDRLSSLPVETFPVAGSHATLMPEYFKRHPELEKLFAQK